MKTLTEAGTDTSRLDLAARSAVDGAIKDTVARLSRRSLPNLYGQAPRDRQAFASILSHYRQHPERLLSGFCATLGERLTSVVRSDLTERFGSSAPDVYVHVIASPEGVTKGVSTPDAIDLHASYNHLLMPIMGVFGNEQFGLTVTDGYEMIRSQIVSALVHAYGRLAQGLNRGSAATREYLGSVDEIDSFSSKAVAELTYKIDADGVNPEQVLDQIRFSLSTGEQQASSQAFDVYLMMLKNTFKGHYASLDPADLTRVWKRFTKLVWQKLASYRPNKSGKTDPWHEEFMRKQWVSWARRLPRSAFIIWLAGHVADDLMLRKPRHISMEELLDAVEDDSTGLMQHDAERFIENYYFGYPSYDPHMYQLINIFRKIVKRKLRRMVNNKKAA